MLVQQGPIVVEILRQPEAARDISVDVVLGMFAMAGVFLLVAALGGLVAGAILVGIRRFRDSFRSSTDTGHVRLRI